MALVISNSSSVQKPRISSFRGDRKPWMLKDFLLDDLGSCSSSGFRSFPRRQCCVAVRNLIELEVRGRNSAGSTSKRLFKSSSSSSSASSRISNAIHKASMAIIGAVKLLPFKSPAEKVNSKGKKKTLLPRSLSKKLFRKSLWKKNPSEDDRKKRECEIDRWISSGAAIVEKYQPSDLSNETTITTTTITTSASTSSSTNSDNWSEPDSEFTQPRSSVDENAVIGKRNPSAKTRRSVTVGDDSVESATTKKNWSNEGEKEQLSPISVLNFPDEDEEIGCSSPFTRRHNHLEGTKEKLMQKLKRFECLSRIGKIKLESRLSPVIEDLEKDSPKLSFRTSPSPLRATNIAPVNEEEYEKMVTKRLLNIIKVKTMSSNTQKLNVDTLLIGFFREGLAKGKGKNRKLVEDTLLIEAENWLYGRNHDEVSIGWKVKDKRKVYVNDMEGGEWRSNRDAEKEEVGIQMVDAILTSLVDEMIGEFSNLELLSLLR